MPQKKIRVGLFCRVLPHYRVPIYERLAEVDDINLMVYYSREPGYYTLKTVDPGDRFPNRRIRMKALRFGGQEVLFQPQMKRIVRSAGHDVVVFHANIRLMSIYPALWAARRRNIGTVWWSIGLMAGKSSLRLAISARLMRLADAVALYTRTAKRYFVGRGLPERGVFVARNTVDIATEREASRHWPRAAAQQFLSEHGLSGRRVFLFCARLTPGKRLDLLLDAMVLLVGRAQDCHLVVIGTGELEMKLKARAAALCLQDRISWLGAVYERERLAPWYASCQALVIPGAVGLAALQGFGYGVPCITHSDPHHQSPEFEAVVDGFNALLYRRGDVTDLADRMCAISENAELRERLATNAVRTMEETYTVDHMVDGLRDAIRFAHAQHARGL